MSARPILGYYHQVRPEQSDPELNGLGVAPQSVVGHARMLMKAGYRLATVSESVAGGETKCAALTFDDGYADNLEHALPALAEIGAVGTIYVVASEIGRNGPSWMADTSGRNRLLTAAELSELSASGWEIGSHCNTHSRLPTLSETDQREELRVSKERLEDLLARPVKSLSYPYGSYSEDTVRLAEELGYDNAVTTARRGGNGSRYAIVRLSLGGYGFRAVKQNTKLGLAIARRRWLG